MSVFQVGDLPLSDIETHFGQSNSTAIANMANDKVLVSINGKENVYSQSQVNQVLKEFFNKKPITSFKVNFSTKESNDNYFIAGKYVSKTDTYRITLRMKKMDSEYKIERITIDGNKYH